MTEDNHYTPPPGVLVPDAHSPDTAQPPVAGTPAPNPGATQPAGGLAKAAVALTGLYTLVTVASALTVRATVDHTKEVLANPGGGSGIGLSSGLGSLASLVSIAAFVVLALWMARIRSNRTAIGEQPGGPPAVEWWGWFIPLANFVLPLLGMRAISRRLVGWTTLLGWWLPFCVVWLIAPISASAAFRAVDFSTGTLSNEAVLDQLVPLTYVSTAALVISWLFLVVIVRRTTARHLDPAA